LLILARGAIAETADVGAMAAVQRTVYGVPPAGSQAVKRQGDPIVFKEAIETLDASGAQIRFVDDSKLTIGAKSKVLIDEFVFDPQNAQGNALINISVGTLRWVTGGMPKGKTVIETPTATLTLRGTDVVVHVHPDGTTDTTVNDGEVDAKNKNTNTTTNMGPGQGTTSGTNGNTDFNGDGNTPPDPTNGDKDPPEHRRNDENGNAQRGHNDSQHSSGPPSSGGVGNGEDDGGDDEGGDDECGGDCS
jgi:hypothetical protein